MSFVTDLLPRVRIGRRSNRVQQAFLWQVIYVIAANERSVEPSEYYGLYNPFKHFLQIDVATVRHKQHIPFFKV